MKDSNAIHPLTFALAFLSTGLVFGHAADRTFTTLPDLLTPDTLEEALTFRGLQVIELVSTGEQKKSETGDGQSETGAEAEASAWEKRLILAGDNRKQIQGFVSVAEKRFDEIGKRAAVFLVEHMPERDLKSMQRKQLVTNLRLALKAREQFPWCQELDEKVFFNEVLPYAVLDETRDPWREQFYRRCAPLVAECNSAGEAAQVLNKELFNRIEVHYNTGRKRPNQSPKESMELKKATCTGLSIILVDACRSVGVPARVAGTPLWTNKRGNHTWIEVFDRGEWKYTGADEYNARGLNRGWFSGDASKADPDKWQNAIWASSWENSGKHFPMVWAIGDKGVGGVNVTARYTKNAVKVIASSVFVRVLESAGGKRLVAGVSCDGESVTTRAGRADRNDMPELKFAGEGPWKVKIRLGEATREREVAKKGLESGTLELLWDGATPYQEVGKIDQVEQWLALLPEERHLSIPELNLSRVEAETVSKMIFEELAKEREDEIEWGDATEDGSVKLGVIRAADKEMRCMMRKFGEAEMGKRSLWISMHGGGGAPGRVNDQQWQNQIRLYEPEEGFYVAPRAPTDSWNLWHEGHIDALFDRLIEYFVATKGVDPNKVYLMGYSAGGDGVYQLAPRMADRFAAAAMMAGHPNNASPLGLRDLPFMIFMGGDDAAYKRNEVAAEWGEKLGALRKDDPEGYEHRVTIYPKTGHWMDRRDAEALPWMAQRKRKAWPESIVWHQSGRTHDRFYWLAREGAKGGETVRAKVDGQTIELEKGDIGNLELRLNDALVDLDNPLVVKVGGTSVFEGKIDRSVKTIWESLQGRLDPDTVAFGTVQVK